MKKLYLVINPCAGKLKAPRVLFDMIQLFSRDYEVTVYPTKCAADAENMVKANGAKYDMVVCSGGDGTLNEVISGVMKCGGKPAIGYIPSGTTNDFAASMKIPLNIKDACEKIIYGLPTPIDIGNFNGRYFAYTASFGVFTESSYNVPQATKNRFGYIAYFLEALKDISNLHKPYHLKVQTSDLVIEDNFMFGAVCNSTSVGGFIKLDTNKVNFNDGLFEVLLIKTPTNPVDTQRIMSDILKKQYNDEYIYFFRTNNIKIETEETLRWSLDGEREEGNHSVEIDIEKSAITIML